MTEDRPLIKQGDRAIRSIRSDVKTLGLVANVLSILVVVDLFSFSLWLGIGFHKRSVAPAVVWNAVLWGLAVALCAAILWILLLIRYRVRRRLAGNANRAAIATEDITEQINGVLLALAFSTLMLVMTFVSQPSNSNRASSSWGSYLTFQLGIAMSIGIVFGASMIRL